MLDALAYQLQVARPGVVEEEDARPPRNRAPFKFEITGEQVLKNLEDRGRIKGIFAEYQPKEDYDPYGGDEFDEAIIKRWNEED